MLVYDHWTKWPASDLHRFRRQRKRSKTKCRPTSRQCPTRIVAWGSTGYSLRLIGCGGGWFGLDFGVACSTVKHCSTRASVGESPQRLDFFANGKLIDTYAQVGPNHNGNRLIQCE